VVNIVTTRPSSVKTILNNPMTSPVGNLRNK
jgi:hypothetical protein